MEECFKRVETKYLISLSQAAAMEAALRQQGFVRMDFGSSRVQSLYYDSPDYRLIRASLERPAFKEKLRLRAYGEPGILTESFLEIKRKYRGIGYKRRTGLPLQAAETCLAQGIVPEGSGQIGREAQWMIRRYSLSPAALISCDRDAWASPGSSGLRITFDRNITFRDWDMDLNARVPGLLLLPGTLRLMEIKSGGAYPLWLTRLLRENEIRRNHFSKYGAAYQRYIRPGTEGIEGGRKNCLRVSLSMGA